MGTLHQLRASASPPNPQSEPKHMLMPMDEYAALAAASRVLFGHTLIIEPHQYRCGGCGAATSTRPKRSCYCCRITFRFCAAAGFGAGISAGSLQSELSSRTGGLSFIGICTGPHGSRRLRTPAGL